MDSHWALHPLVCSPSDLPLHLVFPGNSELQQDHLSCCFQHQGHVWPNAAFHATQNSELFQLRTKKYICLYFIKIIHRVKPVLNVNWCKKYIANVIIGTPRALLRVPLCVHFRCHEPSCTWNAFRSEVGKFQLGNIRVPSSLERSMGVVLKIVSGMSCLKFNL